MSIYGQEIELSDLIKKLSRLELPQVDIKKLCSPCPGIPVNKFISLLQDSQNIALIDVRSEKEYADSHIPGAINVPIFNNSERHNVGLLFKQKSEKLAEQVGAYYAYKKKDQFIKETKEAAKDRPLIIHCWRGGYRSRAVTALLSNNGFSALQLEGGIKAFRKLVYHYLYEYDLQLIALSGQTGTGKSEILEELQTDSNSPILHLEEAACHASSVFGPVRFGCEPIKSQQVFETRLFMQILPWIDSKKELPVFLTEKESNRIGRLNLPPSVQKGLNENQHIKLICDLDARVKRLRREYIDHLNDKSKIYLRERLTYLKKTLSKEKMEEYMTLFDKEEWDILLEKILVEYYDVVYKTTPVEPISTVDSTDINSAIQTITNIIRKKGQE